MIRRGTYQADSKDSRWEYEPVYGLWLGIEPDNESSDGGSNDKISKDQENLEDKEQEEVVVVPLRNPRRLRRGDQRSLRQLKSEIESSKEKLFFIRHIVAGSTQAK